MSASSKQSLFHRPFHSFSSALRHWADRGPVRAAFRAVDPGEFACSRLRCCAGRARVAHVHYSSCFFLPPRVVGGRPTCVPGPASPWQHAALPPHLGSSRSFVARSSSEPPPLAALPPIWFVCSPYFGCALFFPFLGAAGRTPRLRSPPPQAQARLIPCVSDLSCS